MIKVYADHAATTPLSKAAFEAMLPFLRDEFGNPSSLHSWARAPRKAVAEAREMIAKCINAEPDEIFFTSGGTESDNWVVKGSTGGLKAINAPRAIAESTIRITFGPENTVADVDAVLAAIKFALRKQKAIAAKMA